MTSIIHKTLNTIFFYFFFILFYFILFYFILFHLFYLPDSLSGAVYPLPTSDPKGCKNTPKKLGVNKVPWIGVEAGRANSGIAGPGIDPNVDLELDSRIDGIDSEKHKVDKCNTKS